LVVNQIPWAGFEPDQIMFTKLMEKKIHSRYS